MQIWVVCSSESCPQDELEDRLNQDSELGEWPRRTAAGTYPSRLRRGFYRG